MLMYRIKFMCFLLGLMACIPLQHQRDQKITNTPEITKKQRKQYFNGKSSNNFMSDWEKAVWVTQI